MEGEIGVTSVYGKGSEFYFTVHQKLVDTALATEIKVPNSERVLVSGLFESEQQEENLEALISAYGLQYIPYTGIENSEVSVDYLFVDSDVLKQETDLLEGCVDRIENLVALRNPLRTNLEIENALMLNKPLYSLNFCQTINQETLETEVVAEGGFIKPSMSSTWMARIRRWRSWNMPGCQKAVKTIWSNYVLRWLMLTWKAF